MWRFSFSGCCSRKRHQQTGSIQAGYALNTVGAEKRWTAMGHWWMVQTWVDCCRKRRISTSSSLRRAEGDRAWGDTYKRQPRRKKRLRNWTVLFVSLPGDRPTKPYGSKINAHCIAFHVHIFQDLCNGLLQFQNNIVICVGEQVWTCRCDETAVFEWMFIFSGHLSLASALFSQVPWAISIVVRFMRKKDTFWALLCFKDRSNCHVIVITGWIQRRTGNIREGRTGEGGGLASFPCFWWGCEGHAEGSGSLLELCKLFQWIYANLPDLVGEQQHRVVLGEELVVQFISSGCKFIPSLLGEGDLVCALFDQFFAATPQRQTWRHTHADIPMSGDRDVHTLKAMKALRC